MNENKVPLGKRVDRAVENGGMDSRRFMELLMLDTIRDWSEGKGIVTLSDGKTTIQCVVNNPGREWPKQTAEASGCRCKACGWAGKWGDACAVPNDYVCPNCSSYLNPAP